MKKSRTYRATSVKEIRLDQVISDRQGQAVDIGLDVGKEKVFAALRWGTSDFERPWKLSNPGEITDFVKLVSALDRTRKMVVAMEPTGTYGDPLRQALSDAGVVVHRVSPKAAHDYAEVFDGVPSQHDGKDAAVVAELAALGKSSPWAFEVDDLSQELAYWVDHVELQRRMLTIHYGRMESLLARHWPEATRVLPVTSGVLLRCLATYGGPSGLAEDDAAIDRLISWGRGHLAMEKAEQLLGGARHSVGVRQSQVDLRRLRAHAEAAVTYRCERIENVKQLKVLVADHEVIQAQSAAVGVATACVFWVYLGDPRCYDSGPAYRKAMGLNLKERSSGKWQGRLSITKRGHSQVRRWLYFAAIRSIKEASVKQWYEAKKARRPDDPTEAKRAIVAVMRKLALALYQVGANGAEFDASLLFPGNVRSLNAKVV